MAGGAAAKDVRPCTPGHGRTFNTDVTDRRRSRRVLLGHAFVGWALCAATIGVAQAVWNLDVALVVHAIGAPVYFFAVSRHYFRRYAYTTPLQTAVAFVGFVMMVDFFVVGLAVNGSLEMFTSLLGTWVPFALIFAATLLTGRHITPDLAVTESAPARDADGRMSSAAVSTRRARPVLTTASRRQRC